MTQPWAIALLAVLALVVVTSALGCALALRRTRDELEAVQAESASQRRRLEALERTLPARENVATPASYVITGVGAEPEPTVVAEPVEGRLFADLVLRESLLRAASLGYGVRRALSPENRNRVRFEMRREVKRARKQRRSDLRDARRAWQAAGRQEETAA